MKEQPTFKCRVCGFTSSQEFVDCPDCEGRADFEAMRTRDDTQPYGEPEFGINIESGKRCRSCGRTNCEGGATCEIETERRKR